MNKVNPEEVGTFIRLEFLDNGAIDFSSHNINALHLWAAAELLKLKGAEVYMVAEQYRQQQANKNMDIAIARTMPGAKSVRS